MATLPPKFDVTPDQIDRVVKQFYERVRANPTLGPVFAQHITDWAPHEAKVAGFWRNAILHERSYDGNPMRVHQEAGNVQPGMFSIWLDLFEETLRAELDDIPATAWSQLAHNIGRSLRSGVSDRMRPGEVPILKL